MKIQTESKSVCWVTGIAAERSGCSKIPAFVPQLSTRYYCFSPLCFNCAFIVRPLLCSYRTESELASRCCHSVPHRWLLLVMHSLQFTRFTYFSCNHCDRTFVKRKNLKNHMKRYHISPATTVKRPLEKFIKDIIGLQRKDCLVLCLS